MTDKTFAEAIEDLHKEVYNVFLEFCKSLKADKDRLLKWLKNLIRSKG